MSNSIKEDWKDKIASIMIQLRPDLKVKDIKDVLDEVLEENFKNPKAIIYNNYMDDFNVRTDLEQLYGWIETKKPVCAGNGSFFYNQDKVSSPIGKLIDDRQAARKHFQKIRDTFPKGSYEYNHNDMLQMEAKIKINSIYGAFGAATFQLFNLITATSTTATAQSLISTTATGFEAFMTNSIKFENLDQCMLFIDNILNEEYTVSLDGITLVNSREVVYRRLKSTFKQFKPQYEDVIRRALKNCSTEQLTRIYYKNNIYPFVESPLIRNLIISIYDNTECFRDPNHPDDSIAPLLENLWVYFKQYVFYDHFYVERIRRLKQDNRETVEVVDTDSERIGVTA